MVVSVGIVGTGLVGSAFIRQLAPLIGDLNVKVILIARASGYLKNADGMDISELSSLHFQSGTLSPREIAEYLSSSERAVLIDNTASEKFAESYPEFVNRNISLVTPNKKGFSGGLELWKQIFNPNSKSLVYHEATVGAGLPIIAPLRDLVYTGDKVKKIEGILSGTLSYIFNEFSSSPDASFSDIVRQAKSLGYTEPDPRDDLNGMDVARKITILARIAGAKVEGPGSFEVESLIPSALRSVTSANEFLEKLPSYDDDIAKRKQDAAAQGKVLRFVAKVEFPSGKPYVGIEAYDESHPFASLKGSDNTVAFTTERYPSPLIIQGAGAGAEVTAMGVLADLVKVVQRLS